MFQLPNPGMVERTLPLVQLGVLDWHAENISDHLHIDVIQCLARNALVYQIPVSFPVILYATKAAAAKPGSKDRRPTVRKFFCVPA